MIEHHYTRIEIIFASPPPKLTQTSKLDLHSKYPLSKVQRNSGTVRSSDGYASYSLIWTFPSVLPDHQALHCRLHFPPARKPLFRLPNPSSLRVPSFLHIEIDHLPKDRLTYRLAPTTWTRDIQALSSSWKRYICLSLSDGGVAD